MSLAALLLLADSRFPTGAHAHSAGVEPSHGAGGVRSIADLAVFLDGRLATTARTEAAFAAVACRQPTRWAELDHELMIRTPSPAFAASAVPWVASFFEVHRAHGRRCLSNRYARFTSTDRCSRSPSVLLRRPQDSVPTMPPCVRSITSSER